MSTRCLSLSCILWAVTSSPAAWADPCGMVPPIYVGEGVPIVRVGLQKTYVFFKDGVETFVIRPGFNGKVEEFGMLIPFPEPPALRKVSEDIFGHIDNAVDPPEVIVDLRPVPAPAGFGGGVHAAPAPPPLSEPPLRVNEVRVLRQEAVGMYEVAVLEAGSAAALKRWMDDHGFKYPAGMDGVCEEYVKLRWCFVAEKTRVANKSGVDPKPRVKEVNGKLPPGATFDGHVQAMGFRFRTKELIVPMRLSAFNDGELRNVVYLLTDGPRKIRSIPEEYVVRQIAGEELFRNITDPLPLRIIGGTVADIPEWQRTSLPQRRDPAPHNGEARELFANDLLAVKQGRLSHPHEEDEKMLLRIGESLSLRGPDIDRLNLEVLKQQRAKAVAAAVEDVKKMSLTVLDGDFPREVLGSQNLQFAEYTMPTRRNGPQHYDTKQHAPVPQPQGVRHLGKLSFDTPSRRWSWSQALGAISLLMVLVFVGRRVRCRNMSTAVALAIALSLPIGFDCAAVLRADDAPVRVEHSKRLPRTDILGTAAYTETKAEKEATKGWTEVELTSGSPDVASLTGHKGHRVAWFGIVREVTEDKEKKETQLLVEMKYFDGLTDLHQQIVSIFGAGDFGVVIPGTGHKLQKLELVRVYGKVASEEKGTPIVSAEFVRAWDWGLFAFMDYGKDKTNAAWAKLRKVKPEDTYAASPTTRYYEERLGRR